MTAAYHRPFAVAGDFARRYALAIAEAASRGWISTVDCEGAYGRTWQSTWAGDKVFGL